MPQTLFEQIGGEPKLREIIDAFIDRVFADRMIGFFFRNADKNRIKEMEYQLTAEFLGGPVEYRGRPLAAAHAKHPIMGGQFARRLKTLQQNLDRFQVVPAGPDAWLVPKANLRGRHIPHRRSYCDAA